MRNLFLAECYKLAHNRVALTMIAAGVLLIFFLNGAFCFRPVPRAQWEQLTEDEMEAVTGIVPCESYAAYRAAYSTYVIPHVWRDFSGGLLDVDRFYGNSGVCGFSKAEFQ